MGRPRDPAQIARDRRRVADLYLKGWLQSDIAIEIGATQATVSRDLKALRKAWLASTLIDIDKAKSRELAKIDRLEREYWDAWERSQEDKETQIDELRQEGDSPSERVKVQVKKEGQVGNPSFLDGVEWCIDKRCKIFGIAPDKHEVDLAGSLDIKTSGSLTIYEYPSDDGPTDSGA